MGKSGNQETSGIHFLPPIIGGTPEQIARAEEIRARCALVIEDATQYHYDTIANTFPDATPQAQAAMREAARDGVAEVSRKWLGQTAATWWIDQEQFSIAEVIEDSVKVKVLAAAKRLL